VHLTRNFGTFALLLGLTTGLGTARPWTLHEAVGVPFMTEVQLSPNGTLAVVGVNAADFDRNTFDTQYRLVDIATGAIRSLPAHLDHPRWSPDSLSIAWISQGSKGNTTILLTDAVGTKRRAFSQGIRGVVGFTWSPDGSKIAAVETSGPSAHVARIHWLDLENDYRDTQPARRDIWIIDVARGSAQRLTEDGWSYGGPETDHDPS
jgi:Tol biopolymer transport system component